MDEFKSQLLSYLKKANEEFETFETAKSRPPFDALTSIGLINDTCLKILDHIYNYLSFTKNVGHFPRPTSRNDLNYKQFIDKRLLETKDQDNQQLRNFLERSFSIIDAHDCDIGFLDGGMKHRIEKAPRISRKYKMNKYQYSGFGIAPHIENGDLIVPVFGRFRKGSDVRMSGVLIQGPQEFSIIEKLEFIPVRVLGKFIFFEDREKTVKKNLRKWLRNCIDTCEGLIDLLE